MVSKDFILDLADNSNDISIFKKDIMRSVEELLLVYKAACYCRDVQELEEFIENI
jgi:hypothetical protein